MPRIFFAIPVPDHVKGVMQDIRDDLRDLPGQIKWVRADAIHLTVKFIGEVEKSRAEQLWTALEDIDFPDPFEVALSGVGVFPNPRRPRVLWVGLNHGDELKSLAATIDERLQQEEVEPESREFHPHLTLGRVKGKGLPRETLETFLDMEVPGASMPVEKIICYKSDLQPTGAVYTKLHTIEF